MGVNVRDHKVVHPAVAATYEPAAPKGYAGPGLPMFRALRIGNAGGVTDAKAASDTVTNDQGLFPS